MNKHPKILPVAISFIIVSSIPFSCEPADSPEKTADGFYKKVFVTFEQEELESGLDLDYDVSFSLKDLYEKDSIEYSRHNSDSLYYDLCVIQKGRKTRYLYSGEESEEGSVFYYLEDLGNHTITDINYAFFPGTSPFISFDLVEGRFLMSSHNRAAVSDDNHFHLQNLSGTLCVRIYHEKDVPINSFILRGNNDESFVFVVSCSIKKGEDPSIVAQTPFVEINDINWPNGIDKHLYKSEKYTDVLLTFTPAVFENGISIITGKDSLESVFENDYLFIGTAKDKIEIQRNTISLVEMKLKPIPLLYYSTFDGKPAIRDPLYYSFNGSWGGYGFGLSYNYYTNAYDHSVSMIKNEYKDGTGYCTFNGIPTKIASGAFSLCKNLTSIDIPDYITDGIGEGAFNGCENLEHISMPSVLTFIGGSAFRDCFKLTELELPENLENLGKHAFERCQNLTEISIPSKIEIIEEHLFSKCSKLASVHLQGNVKRIERNAFSECPQLSHINIPPSVEAIGISAFEDCEKLLDISFPQRLKYLGEYAFSGCSNISEIDLSRSEIDTIRECTFRWCHNLTRAEMPNGLKRIENQAFWQCQNLEEIVLHEGLKSIGKAAFNSCSSLKSIVIPSSVESIEDLIVTGCTNLRSITVLAKEPPKGSPEMFAFHQLSLCTIYVPAESLEKYRNAEHWNLYAQYMKAIEY